MTIGLRQAEPTRPLGEWLLPNAPIFLTSDTYDLVVRDLERYARKEIKGRSYLIAGHRGAGKTALISRAIEDLRSGLLAASTGFLGSVRQRGPLQRPLLVKLYGPSLLEPLPPTAAELRAKAAKAASQSLAGAPAGDGAEEATRDDDSATAVPADKDARASQAVLVQITIALYRALAAEIAEGYGVHAREYGLRREGEALELAAQIALELDTATSPATLRSFWRRLNRLRFGVLWPRGADQQLATLGLNDQGVREIVAVATAGQAFEVCSGVVNYKITDKRSASQSSEVKGEGKTDLREVVGRLGSLGVGALTGAALWASDHFAAISFGSLVWLLGSATLSWSFQRKQTADRTADYTFLRDRTIQTLDRDLPLVIYRVREAGLTPVFVVDELDKLENPPQQIGDIIHRLKHIVSDYGFFCFLTDRAYFDFVEQTTQANAYPKEHTYFSVRRLVTYSPAQMTDFAAMQVAPDDEAPPAERFACDVFALWATHKAKLNFTALTREIGRIASAGPKMSDMVLRMPAQPDVQLAVTVQLAIDLVLSEDSLSRRISQDGAFAQLAYDAVYALSRAWESDTDHYDASPEALRAYLSGRLSTLNSSKAGPPPAVDEVDLRLLVSANRALIEFLLDFNRLAARLRNGSLQQVQMAAILPLPLGGLIRRRSRMPQTLDFNFDCYGQDLRATAARIGQPEIEDLRAVIAQFDAMLAALALDMGQLTAAGLLPATVSAAGLRQASSALGAWTPAADLDRPTSQAVAVARALRSTLETQGPHLAAGLVLAKKLRAAAPAGAALSDAIEVLVRYPVLGPPGQPGSWPTKAWSTENPNFPDLSSPRRLSGEPEAIQAWTQWFTTAPPGRRAPAETKSDALWTGWTDRFATYFTARDAPLAPITYRELVAAVRGAAPSAMLRSNLDAMSAFDWSRLCLAALPVQKSRVDGALTRDTRAALVAALRGLGFGSELLKAVAKAPELGGRTLPLATRSAAERLAMGADSDPKRTFLVIVEGTTTASALASTARQGILYIRRSDLSAYALGLNWLQTLNAFTAVLHEDAPPASA